MIIRDMTVSDARRVAEIHTRAWQVAYEGILPSSVLDNINLEERVEMWRDTIIPMPNRDNIVLEEDGALLGWAAHGPSRDDDKDHAATRELYGIYINPDRFRHGYGRMLWAEVLKRMSIHEYLETTLWVLEENGRARGFYEKMGFELDAGISRKVDWLGGAVEVRYTRQT